MDKDMAIEEMRVLAEQGDMKAQFHMGMTHMNGIEVISAGELKVVEHGYSKALEWFTKAAKQGYADAQNSLGLMYKEGLAILQNDYEAFEWFTKAAKQGYADAQNSLGLMYKEGLAILQNDYEAFEWFTKAAEQGHADAQNNLGLIYRDGKETPQVVYMILHDYEHTETIPSDQDYEELFKDFGLDSPESFDYLDVAKALSKTQGIDHDKAVDWFIEAVANGNVAAQINLKSMLNT